MYENIQHNCCQSVFCRYAEKYGMSHDEAFRIGAFFNAGMRQGEVCGAVSGALMVLGMEYGDETWHDNKKPLEFIKVFKERYGTVKCAELTKKCGRRDCPTYIKFAQEYLDQELNKKREVSENMSGSKAV